MGKPRLPKGPTITPAEQLAQEQEHQVERLYAHIERCGRTRDWLDHLILICCTSRGDHGLLQKARSEAADREEQLQKLTEHARLTHVQLHAILAPSSVPCMPEERRMCVSIHPTLVAHFRACQAVGGDLARQRLRRLRLRSRTAWFEDLPSLTRTSGGAAAYLHDKFRFKHRHIALLCMLRENGSLPVLESGLKLRTDAVKKAYSLVPEEQRPKVKVPRWTDR